MWFEDTDKTRLPSKSGTSSSSASLKAEEWKKKGGYIDLYVQIEGRFSGNGCRILLGHPDNNVPLDVGYKDPGLIPVLQLSRAADNSDGTQDPLVSARHTRFGSWQSHRLVIGRFTYPRTPECDPNTFTLSSSGAHRETDSQGRSSISLHRPTHPPFSQHSPSFHTSSNASSRRSSPLISNPPTRQFNHTSGFCPPPIKLFPHLPGHQTSLSWQIPSPVVACIDVRWSSKGHLGEYLKNFWPVATYLKLKKPLVGDNFISNTFIFGLPRLPNRQIHSCLAILKPDHHTDDSYDFDDIHDAVIYILSSGTAYRETDVAVTAALPALICSEALSLN
ncbi:hypothetical protein BKA70DRAFT_1242507 [Coprinopsis sp. MPI-PUGE-AT-0042]|nr:hypothetical protein BKA70DRAFT_1242507 [Coprinopsis sp. MPI-PUGE-AT-0042]